MLKKDKLEPGDLVFVDQFESQVPSQIFSPRGSKIHSRKYKGGTVYYDAATGRMKVYLQDSFTAEETAQTKLRFERENTTEGVYIKAYNTDNGVFTAEQFMKEVFENFQGTRRSGVGGHHHNGVAEKAIKDITRMSRTMMVHQALRWPKMVDKSF